MLSLIAAVALHQAESTERCPSVYRMPAAEVSSRRFKELLDDEFDSLCIDPAPTAAARATMKGKLKFVSAKQLDTPANRKWRDATIAFANGNISPKQYVARTTGLHETYHWLSSPKTPALRDATPSQPLDPTYSGRSVFAEMILLSSSGTPCLTSGDCWLTRDLPDAGRLQSWVLAMNDYRGPMLSYRNEHKFMVTSKPQVLRADAKLGLLVLHQGPKSKGFTVFFNNSMEPLEAAGIKPENALGMGNGVDMEGPKPRVRSLGMVIVPD